MGIRLTRREIRALLAAAGNVDPCMFIEDVGGREGERQYEAWISGRGKLEAMLRAGPASARGRRLGRFAE